MKIFEIIYSIIKIVIMCAMLYMLVRCSHHLKEPNNGRAPDRVRLATV